MRHRGMRPPTRPSSATNKRTCSPSGSNPAFSRPLSAGGWWLGGWAHASEWHAWSSSKIYNMDLYTVLLYYSDVNAVARSLVWEPFRVKRKKSETCCTVRMRSCYHARACSIRQIMLSCNSLRWNPTLKASPPSLYELPGIVLQYSRPCFVRLMLQSAVIFIMFPYQVMKKVIIFMSLEMDQSSLQKHQGARQQSNLCLGLGVRH